MNPHQEGDAYKSLDSAVARNTVCRSASFIPWVRRMRSANKAQADDEITAEMCCSMENCPVNVTPNNFTLITRRMSGSSGISWICRILGREMIISWDFLQFNWRLFLYCIFGSFSVSFRSFAVHFGVYSYPSYYNLSKTLKLSDLKTLQVDHQSF